jgi:two-component system, chemotaxis family, chemotaxis protein CheY
MLVTTHNTEHKLYQDLKDAVRHTPSRKCFSMEFSKSGIPRPVLLEAFLKVLDDVPNSYMAQVYICADMDIFILMQGFMQRHFLDFTNDLSKNLGDAPLMQHIQIYEIGLHWRNLENICLKKLEFIENELLDARIKLRREENLQKADSILNGLDATSIATISERRAASPKLQVLVADDDQLTRALVGNVLGSPLQTSFSHNGKETLRDYVALAPDVLFLDIGLPDINGHKILESLIQLDPDAYIIMLSGRRDKANILKALESGAQGFIGKPFTRSKLFEYVYKSPYIKAKHAVMEQSNSIPGS